MRATDWLWANPVLRREWSQSRRPASRLRAAASWLGLILVLTSYGAAAWWLSRPQRTPWEARAVLLTLCLSYLLCVSVGEPGASAARISGERERGTWQALLLTALRPSQIIAAKLLAGLRLPALALVQLLPLLMMSTHAARLPMTRLALLALILLVASLVAVAASLALSGRCRHTRTATALAYLASAGFVWGALAVSPPAGSHWKNLWWYLSPAWEAAVLCLAEPRRLPTTRPLLPEWAWFLLLCALTTALVLFLLIRRVGSAMNET